MTTLEVSGKDVEKLFKNEAGGHRFQRIPPTERGGRVHTSTITVTILRAPTPTELVIPDRDLQWKMIRGSGSGGQKRNKTSNAVQLLHLPTQTMVRCESERSLTQNEASALAHLRSKLLAEKEARERGAVQSTRRDHCGSGMRGDKRRTIAIQRDEVVDHVTGKRTSAKRYLKGWIEDLS